MLLKVFSVYDVKAETYGRPMCMVNVGVANCRAIPCACSPISVPVLLGCPTPLACPAPLVLPPAPPCPYIRPGLSPAPFICRIVFS